MKPVTPALAHQVGDQSVHAFRVNLAIAAPTRRVHRRLPLLVEENHRRQAANGRSSAKGSRRAADGRSEDDEILEGRHECL